MDSNKFTFVGHPCGNHASYSFYKAIKYSKNGQTKILSLGEFFFVKIWPNSDLVAIGELQLLWEDKNTDQTLSSLRLYFLPEYTPEGRMHYHGEDEIVAVSEKAVLRVSDLLDWIASPKEIHWDRGLKGVCEADCKPFPGNGSENNMEHQYDKGLNAKFSPGHSEFLSDVRQEKETIGDVRDLNDLGVIIVNSSQYSRYRSVLKRVQGVEDHWMHNSLIVSLGGFTTPTRRTYVLFCREIFDYAELEEHPYLCNHLAPKLKGRPRKRKKIKRPGSPESVSSSESSASTSHSVSTQASTKSISKNNGIKKDLLSMLSQKHTKDETEFLKKLISFMERRETPIERPPMLGYKQIDLHLFFDKVAQVGGYDGCMTKKAWKSIYDDLGGNPQNTSAATCTRRHYEKFLLPYERHTKGLGENQVKRRESESGSSEKSSSSLDNAKSERLLLKSENEENHNKSDNDSLELQSQEDNNTTNNLSNKKELEEDNKGCPIWKDTKVNEVDQEEEEEELIETNDNNKNKMSGSQLSPPGSGPPPHGHPLLDQVKNLIGSSKHSDREMKIDPEGKQLQIDDLIIIPNNLAATPPEGGSALQNLAKIASRYQNQKENPTTNPDMIWNNADSIRSSSHHQHHQENLTTDYSSSSMAKKPKLDHSGGPPSTMIGGGTIGGGGHAPHHNNPPSATPPTNKPVAPPPTTPNAAATAAAAAAASSAASLAALAAMNPMSMTPAQQQSLLSMLPPGLFGMPTTPTKAASNHPSKDYSLNNPHHSSGGAGGLSSSAAATPTKSTAAVSSAAAGAGLLPPGLGDPSKLGPEALQLLQLYEKTLKAVVGGQTAAGALSASSLTMPSKSSLSSSSPKPRNASGSSSNAGSPQLQSAKDRDRNKVNRLPLDAKKPLAPQGHIPSAFAQSSTIYTNPLADLLKAKETNSSQGSSSASSATEVCAIDLSSHKKSSTPHHHHPPPAPPVIHGGLNLKKESALKAITPMMDLTMKTGSSSSTGSSHHHHGSGGGSHHHHHNNPKNEVKVSPFSAEALLSKSSSSSSNTPVSLHRGSGSNMHSVASVTSTPSKVATPPRASPSTYAPPRASPLFSPSTSQTSSEKSRSSPWHTPVSLGSSSGGRPPGTSSAKPAIPVSPVVREDKNKDLSFQAALLGLGAAAAGTNAASAAGMPPVSLPLPPTTYGNSFTAAQQSMASMAAAANPYLALAAAGGMPKSSASQSSSFPSHLMDPTSAYYAALYSQSLYGLGSPYAAAAGMRLPGMSHSAAAAAAAASALAAPPANQAGSSAAANAMDLMALQAMMSRGQTASAGPSSNPYAAGYPASALSGLLGYPGFPPAPPHGGRKDP